VTFAQASRKDTLHRIVKGATGTETVRRLTKLPPNSPEYHEAIAPWLAAARELAREGVRAITTSCGFTAMFQRELSEAVDIPVFASSLLLAPLIARMIKPSQFVGVITADAKNLGERHLAGVGVQPGTLVIRGLESCPVFEEMSFQDSHEVDVESLRNEVVSVGRSLLEEEPRVAAILLECSLLPPFAKAVQEATRLPVFDFTHLVHMVHDAVSRKPFVGIL
jgi:Asp/Glu/hydantoin racemase